MGSVEHILETLVIGVVLGIGAQLLAHRLKLPAILPLLLFGMAAGPSGLGLFDPHYLGPVLEAFLHLGVAIILFEGGLSLDLSSLRSVGRSVRNLLSVGVLVTWAGAAALAHYLIGVGWGTASLFGAIVTVTGPTVVTPLLRHMVAPRPVRTILVSEGLMIDPIGAVLAYLVLLWIERSGLQFQALTLDLLKLFATGAVLGYVAGAMARYVARNRHIGGELRNLAVLALLMGSFMIAEGYAKQSGIVAAVVMGLVVSASHIPDASPLKDFKGQLTVLIISLLFILLSGQLDLGAIRDLGLPGLLVAVGLVLLVRPLSVLASVPPSRFSWREKTVLGLTAPRGIVAAAVASLAAIQLRNAGYVQDATSLEGLVYLTILFTCAWATVMAMFLPRFLGYLDDPSRRLLVMVGANAFSKALAGLFRERGWMSLVIDSDTAKLSPLREEGILTVRGDARSVSTYDDAGVERDTEVLALTANDELNLLIAEIVRDEFGVEHPVVAMQSPSNEIGQLRMAWVDQLGGRQSKVLHWSSCLESGKARFHHLSVPEGRQETTDFRALHREGNHDCLIICGWRGGKPHFKIRADELDDYDEITLLVDERAMSEELTSLIALAEKQAEESQAEETSSTGQADASGADDRGARADSPEAAEAEGDSHER